MSHSNRTISITEVLSSIRGLIQRKEWNKALQEINNKKGTFFSENRSKDVKIIESFENLIVAMIDLENGEIESTLSKLKAALKTFPRQDYELERSIVLFHLGNIFNEKKKSEKAKRNYFEAWDIIKETEFVDLKLEFVNKILSFFIQQNEYPIIIGFLKEKLLLLDEETQETEYHKTILLLITYLIQRDQVEDALYFFEKIQDYNYLPLENIQNQINEKIKTVLGTLIGSKTYDQAFNFIEQNKIQLDLYIDEFEPLITSFVRSPTVPRLTTLIHLITYPYLTQTPALDLVESWKQRCYPKIGELIVKSPKLVFEIKGLKSIISEILKNKALNEEFIYNLSKITDDLVEDPSNKEVMSYLLYMNEALQESGNKSLAHLVHSWISSALAIRKSINLTHKIIYHFFEDSKGTFAPLSLLKHFFESEYKKASFHATISLCNTLSEFLGEIAEFVYELPNSQIKMDTIEVIDNYTKTIASGYEYIMFDRMKRQDIDMINVLASRAISTTASVLFGDISVKYPSTFTLCLDSLIKKWTVFPTLAKTKYDYLGSRVVAVKSVFWFIILQSAYPAHFQNTYQRLSKSEKLQHKQLKEIVRANLNFFYEFKQCIISDSSIPSSQFPDVLENVIKYLKSMNDMVKFTDDELRELVFSSQWKSYSKKILEKVIELKNYCVFCSYNMPANSKKCPKCGKEVGQMPTEAPSIDLGAMDSFFSSPTSYLDTSDTIDNTETTDITGTPSERSRTTEIPIPVKCPKCYKLTTFPNKICEHCGFQIPERSVTSIRIEKCPKCGYTILEIESSCRKCGYQKSR